MNIHASDLNPLRAPYPELGGRDAMEAIAYPAVMGAAAGLMPFTGAGGVLEGKTAAQARGLLRVAPALQANTTIYVSTTGSDATGDGSAAKPYGTIQHAVDAIPAWMNGYDATIQIAPGSYAENVLIKDKVGGTVTLRGTGPGSVVTIGALWGSASNVRLSNMTLKVTYNSALSYAKFGDPFPVLTQLDMGARAYQDCVMEIDGGGMIYVGLSAIGQSSWGISASNRTMTIKNMREYDGRCVLASNGANISLGEGTVLQNYKVGLVAIYLGRVSCNSLTATSSYTGSTKISTVGGGRILLGGNADTTNYQY